VCIAQALSGVGAWAVYRKHSQPTKLGALQQPGQLSLQECPGWFWMCNQPAYCCCCCCCLRSLAGGNFDAAAAATSRYLPVESAMPGTTLGIIPLQAFETGGTLYGEATSLL
jgi:hypothetical protein